MSSYDDMGKKLESVTYSEDELKKDAPKAVAYLNRKKPEDVTVIMEALGLDRLYIKVNG